MKTIYQVNLSENLGGAEVYTHFFSRALSAAGRKTVIFIKKDAKLWQSLGDFPESAEIEYIPVKDSEEILNQLPFANSIFILHTPISTNLTAKLIESHTLIVFAHHAFARKSFPPYYKQCHLVLSVSEYMSSLLVADGVNNYYANPLYGVASLNRKKDVCPEISIGPIYKWDKHKIRDRLLSHLHPLIRKFLPSPIYRKKPGITLGIVSRISPIKQFPLLFSLIGPIIKKFPHINIEIFGSGEGYAQVRDLMRSIGPIKNQVRFWGEQNDVQTIYKNIDFLLVGLPDREALGLNVIEAQFCGTPVLAIDAPPFTETVIHEISGFLYQDPRLDNGLNFEALLSKISALESFPNPMVGEASCHLDKFTFASFATRIDNAIKYVERQTNEPN